MEDKLLTRSEVAARWQVTEKSIDNWTQQGIITKCKQIPVIRYSLSHIMELEGVKIDKFSPLERRNLESEIERLKLQVKEKDNEIAGLKSCLSEIAASATEALFNNRKLINPR